MIDVTKPLEVNRNAVNEFISASEWVASKWTTPRAPGKWSPSQVVEHIARVYDESAELVAGSPSKFPNFPTFLRPVMRGLFFNKFLKTEKFSKAKTFKPFNPESGPSSAAEGRVRVEAALAKFHEGVADRFPCRGDEITDFLMGDGIIDQRASLSFLPMLMGQLEKYLRYLPRRTFEEQGLQPIFHPGLAHAHHARQPHAKVGIVFDQRKQRFTLHHMNH